MMQMRLIGPLVAATCLLVPAAAMAEAYDSQHHRFEAVKLVEPLAHPWAIAFLPDGDWLITERPGRLRRVHEGALIDAPIEGLPQIPAVGQGGLLDVVVHPDFANNQLVYLTYAKACGERSFTTAIGRGRYTGTALAGFQEIYVAEACAPGGRHHGSRLVFDNAGYLFVTVGDRGQQDRAQDPNDHAGVTLRLHDDGRIPEDNPFVAEGGGHPAVWTYGNRNAQGMARHPVSGEIWANEHGPRGGDELNVLLPGRNYGWPAITYGVEYSGATITEFTEKEGMEQPIKYWVPSIAPSGMAFYTGDAFPEWRNDVFVGALVLQHVARLRFDGHRVVEEERLLDQEIGRIRDVRVAPDGLIYLLTDSPRGALYRLQPAE